MPFDSPEPPTFSTLSNLSLSDLHPGAMAWRDDLLATDRDLVPHRVQA